MPSYVVAGASRGIGLEFARQLSAVPSNIVVALIRNKATAGALIALQDTRKNLHVVIADITDRKALSTAAEDTKSITGGTLDCLINNAAYLGVRNEWYTLDEAVDEEKFNLDEDMMNNIKGNLLGPIYTTNAFLPLLKAAAATTTAKVIFISTLAADVQAILDTEYGEAAAYSISKAALNMAVAKYAARFKHENVVFLALSPGVVDNFNGNPPPALAKIFGVLFERFKAGFPEWNGTAWTPEQSIHMMLDVINKVEPKDSGKFLSHYGNERLL